MQTHIIRALSTLDLEIGEEGYTKHYTTRVEGTEGKDMDRFVKRNVLESRFLSPVS